MIIEEIDRRFKERADRSSPGRREGMEKAAILWDGQANMANLCVICCATVNGVSEIHSAILKAETFKELHSLMPEKFRSVTNGVNHRRFLLESNPGLARLISQAIGEGWIGDASELGRLTAFKSDACFLEGLMLAKRENKLRLAGYIKNKTGITLDPDSMFDVQAKRFHAYKRQLLFALKLMHLYNSLKAGADVAPTTFIAAGKAAPGYGFAKETIRLICAAADIVNGDPDAADRLKVVFLEDFGVSTGQLLYPAADVSEQISAAGKEASGTGNMKFMMNGAVTLGTADGANIEIAERAGRDNAFIFGLAAEEALRLTETGAYSARGQLESDERLRLLCGRLDEGILLGRELPEIREALLRRNDEYFVFRDFGPYIEASRALSEAYGDRLGWARLSLSNIAGSGYFSSDRAVAEYMRDIGTQTGFKERCR